MSLWGNPQRILMSKNTFIFLVVLLLSNPAFACDYADCKDNVFVHQQLLQKKLTAAYSAMDGAITGVESSLSQHNSALEEQVAVLTQLRDVSIKNNLLYREIAQQKEKASGLLNTQAKLSSLKAEAGIGQSGSLLETTALKSSGQ